MRPVFCGNFEYETRQSDLERLFGKYGRIERVDMKSGTSTKEMSFYLGSRTSLQKPLCKGCITACLLSFYSQMESFRISFTRSFSRSSVTHSLHCLKLPFHKNGHGGICQIITQLSPSNDHKGNNVFYHAMPTITDHKRMNEFYLAMPSITEFVLYEWRSMLTMTTQT